MKISDLNGQYTVISSKGATTTSELPPQKKTFLQKASDVANIASFGVGRKTGEAIGTAAGALYTKAKDLIKGTKNYDNYDLSAPSPLQVGADVASGAFSVAGFKGLKPAGSLLKTALKESALDAGAGAASEIADKGKDATVGGVAKQAALWGTLGAAIPVVGKGIGKTIEKFSPTVRAAKKESKLLKRGTLSPRDLSSVEYEEALRKGKVLPGSTFKTPQYVPSSKEKEIALKYKHLLGSKEPIGNLNSVTKEITKKDQEVGEFLRKNNSIFNSGELKNYVLKRMEDVTDIAIPEGRINKLKNNLADGFIKALKKNDMESLWQGRKNFDQSIEKLFTGSPTMQKTVKKEFRNAVQDFIAERTPDGVYKGKMTDMRELFNLSDVLSSKALGGKSKTEMMKWIRDNPNKAKIVGLLGGSAILGFGAHAVNAGN